MADEANLAEIDTDQDHEKRRAKRKIISLFFLER